MESKFLVGVIITECRLLSIFIDNIHNDIGKLDTKGKGQIYNHRNRDGSFKENTENDVFFKELKTLFYLTYVYLLYCGRVPAANALPDALQPKAYCTNPGL